MPDLWDKSITVSELRYIMQYKNEINAHLEKINKALEKGDFVKAGRLTGELTLFYFKLGRQYDEEVW